MKNIFLCWNFFIAVLCIFFSITASAVPISYKLDPNHTAVLWHISHFGFSQPTGKWMAEGSLILDQAKPENSKVKALIHVDTLSTGLAELDKHLKSDQFFDVQQYPTASFESNKVILTSANSAQVQGILTLHGVSRPITLHVKLNKLGVNPINKKESAGFSATALIHRSDFKINAYLPGLGDDVILDIQAEAAKS